MVPIIPDIVKIVYTTIRGIRKTIFKIVLGINVTILKIFNNRLQPAVDCKKLDN